MIGGAWLGNWCRSCCVCSLLILVNAGVMPPEPEAGGRGWLFIPLGNRTKGVAYKEN